jgi:hypothetical protein
MVESSSHRLVEITGDSWFSIGSDLAARVSQKSAYAYRYDRYAYSDDAEILSLWRETLAPLAKKSMELMTPDVFQFCSGFDTFFSLLGDGFSVWELLTLYEVDTYRHLYHYKCNKCQKRITQGFRYYCSSCPSSPRRRKSAARSDPLSVCSPCDHSTCPVCSGTLIETNVLHNMESGESESGCTGFGSRRVIGQTLDMATDTYNYGRNDLIYKINYKNFKIICYDVGCILSPFGINSSPLCLSVFNLYIKGFSIDGARVPMAAVQWEILFNNLKNFDNIQTICPASFIIKQGAELNLIEISPEEKWVCSKELFIRANHSIEGSPFIESAALSPDSTSKTRQSELETNIARVGEQISIEAGKSCLSSKAIQNDHCLATILMEDLRMHVRFRVGTRISTTVKDGGKWELYQM